MSSIDLTDAFDKLQNHLRHSCAAVGCSHLDQAEEAERGVNERQADEVYNSYRENE